MPIFFSKKQKAEFRKRRRRVKGAVKQNGVIEETTEAKSSSETPPTVSDQVNDIKQDQKTNVVFVPKGLDSRDAKKFRKDARRKARAEGQVASELEFVVEGTKPPPKNINGRNQPQLDSRRKKRKLEFPRLNDLVAEEATAKAKKEEDEARKLAEGVLSDEYKSRYLALDCEMVGIGTDSKKSALARVSIVDWDGNCVLDTFVQVPTRVTDFRTHVSGVTASDIRSGSGAIKETECRDKVAKILHNKVLVGHALKNDLHALLLTHPKENIRDTAKHQPFQRLGGSKWRPRKLRDLVKEHLGLTIQQAGQSHDSTQDAWASMQLFRLVREKWEQDLEEKSSKKRRID